MKHTVSYLFYQQKGFDRILQMQPWILAQAKRFLFSLGKQNKTKQYAINRKEHGWAQNEGLGGGVSLGGGQFLSHCSRAPVSFASSQKGCWIDSFLLSSL